MKNHEIGIDYEINNGYIEYKSDLRQKLTHPYFCFKVEIGEPFSNHKDLHYYSKNDFDFEGKVLYETGYYFHIVKNKKLIFLEDHQNLSPRRSNNVEAKIFVT